MKRENFLTHFKRSTTIALVAAVANMTFLIFARETADIDPAFEPLQTLPILLFTLASGYAAYLILQVFKKYLDRPYEYFMYFSGLVLIFSFMPIGHRAVEMEGANMAEINVLGTLHVIAAVFILVSLAKLEEIIKNDNVE